MSDNKTPKTELFVVTTPQNHSYLTTKIDPAAPINAFRVSGTEISNGDLKKFVRTTIRQELSVVTLPKEVTIIKVPADKVALFDLYAGMVDRAQEIAFVNATVASFDKLVAELGE